MADQCRRRGCQSYNDLLKDKNSLEEKCSLLESKMLKLIDMVKSGKFSQSGSQVARPLIRASRDRSSH